MFVPKRIPGLLAVLLMALAAGCAPEYNVTKTPVPPPPPPQHFAAPFTAGTP